jgi:LydA holin phage, holin superfamily III
MSTSIKKEPNYVTVFTFFAFLLYPINVWSYAHSDSLLILGIHWVEYLYVLALSSWGAVAYSLQKITEDDKNKIKSKTLLVFKDLVNSQLAALLVFLLCNYFEVAKTLAAVMFTLAGYGGARTLEKAWLLAAKRTEKELGVEDGYEKPKTKR